MTMSLVWVGMVFLSCVAAVFLGNTAALAAAVLEGAKNGITLSLSIAGVLCLWSGVCAVLEKSGIQRRLAKLLLPLLRLLFPTVAADEEASSALSGNITANLLGLGNAATPLGIRAVQRLKELSGRAAASDDMCLLIVMNTASIQLIPATVAAVRSSYGAKTPFDILPAVWLTSVCSVSAGILAAKLLKKLWRS